MQGKQHETSTKLFYRTEWLELQGTMEIEHSSKNFATQEEGYRRRLGVDKWTETLIDAGRP